MTDHKSKITNKKSSKLAHWLDDRFKIPGTDIRFGLDPVISLVPGVGDWLTGMVSGYFIILGAKEKVAPSVLLRMGFNVLLDILIGSVPLLGDLFDFGWKANIRNAKLLEKYGKGAQSVETQSKWLLWAVAVVLLLLIVGALVLIGWAIVAIIEAVL